MAASVIAVAGALAGVPVTGRPVSELAWLDDEVRDLMDQNEITCGLVAVMRNGKVIYQRGFGWVDEAQTTPTPETCMSRIASCTKPITAACIRRLIDDGLLSLNDKAFDLGQPGGGILNLTPFPSLGDQRLKDITIQHLLSHEGGWDRDIAGDLTYMECTIASDMGVASPPGRTNTLRWILGQPLQFTPGARSKYSNIGYLALGLIVEELSGQSLLSYMRSRILTPQDWVPATDLIMGRTFQSDADPREIWYDTSGGDCVFDNLCPQGCGDNISNVAYGGWDHEARTGQGRIVLSPATMLRMLDRYYVQILSDDIGTPLGGTRRNADHGGVLPGCNAYAWQRTDGINVFMVFNKAGEPEDFGERLRNRIAPLLSAQTNWPSLDVEGFWVLPVPGLPSAYGSYDRPHRAMVEALALHTDGTSLNLRAGSYDFTGRIATRMRVRAPLGAARIGD
jgi:N-acyl-D-amino-acid deacylase